MLRVIFDTNIYGNLLEEPDAEEIERKIREEKDFVVYNFPLFEKKSEIFLSLLKQVEKPAFRFSRCTIGLLAGII